MAYEQRDQQEHLAKHVGSFVVQASNGNHVPKLEIASLLVSMGTHTRARAPYQLTDVTLLVVGNDLVGKYLIDLDIVIPKRHFVHTIGPH